MKFFIQNIFYRKGKNLMALMFAAALFVFPAYANGQQPVSSESIAANPSNAAGVVKNREQLRVAKSYARMSFKKYLQRKVIEKTREMVIEIKDWTFDDEKERYMIEYEVSYEILKDDYYGDEWVTLRKTFVLSCDIDGKNANLKNAEDKLNYIFENINN